MKLEFKTIEYGSLIWKRAVKLREEVLRNSLGKSFSLEELNTEKDHLHVVAEANGKLVGTAVLVKEKDEVKMQRVAISERFRNLSIGSKMMSYCEEVTKSINRSYIYCHARHTAVEFYTKNGYWIEGDYFDEDGLPHVRMGKYFGQ